MMTPERCSAEYQADLNDSGEHNHLISLPTELLYKVFHYIDASDLLNLERLSSYLRCVSLDQSVWESKLNIAATTKWFTLSSCCYKKKTEDLGLLNEATFENLQSLHPRDVYIFTSNFVPPAQLDESNAMSIHKIMDCYKSIDEDSANDVAGSFVSNFLNRIIKNMIAPIQNRINYNLKKKRFAVFGSGFDTYDTNRLFNRILDSRKKCFEPIQMFSGDEGFGNGLTILMYAEAQQMLMNNLHQYFEPKKGNKKNLNYLLGWDNANSEEKNRAGSSQNPSEEHQDFIFDLIHLFSNPVHLNFKHKTQLSRITKSRFFKTQVTETIDDQITALESLEVSETLAKIVKDVNGLIYAIDGRNSYDDLEILKYELDCISEHFYSRGRHIPLFVVYIMPKEHLNVTPRSSKVGGLQRTDTYSGSEYTCSWNGSLVDPFKALKLYEQKLPWRLQKCSSNDVKAFLSGMMWLKSCST